MKKVMFKSSDGLEVFGHLSLPESNGRQVPGVLFVTGGIHGGIRRKDGRYDPLHKRICQYFTERNFATFIVDKRGSRGHGEKYMSLLDFCGREIDDILAGATYFKEAANIQPGSLAIHGTSRGATAAALAISRAEIFDAAILSSGFFDILRQYKYDEVARPVDFPTKQVLQGVPIEEFPHTRLSPIHNVANVHCPVMIVHGLDDRVVPVEQSLTYYEALRVHTDTKLVIYPNFAHFKLYSYPTNPVGRTYWEDCVAFLEKSLNRTSRNVITIGRESTS